MIRLTCRNNHRASKDEWKRESAVGATFVCRNWALVAGRSGGGDYWGPRDQDQINRIVRRAVELGVTYFDTAEAYNEGRSEESLGVAIRGLPRDKLIIGTKDQSQQCRAGGAGGDCEASLKRLGVETIDLYMVHWPIAAHLIVHFNRDCGCPSVSKAFETLMSLRSQEKSSTWA